MTVYRAPALARRAPARVASVTVRRSPRRSGGGRGALASIPWKDILIVGAIGYYGGKWLRGPDGVKAMADAKKTPAAGPLRAGTGAPLIVGGLAAAYLHPALRGPGHLLAGAGAVLVGLRMASRDEKGAVRATEISGPDLEALAATTAGFDDGDDD